MVIIDIAILAVFALFFLSGFYKGFLWNLFALLASLAALVMAFLLMGRVSKIIAGSDVLYDAMLNYIEGSEHIYDVDLVEKDIVTLSNDQIDEIMERSNLPFPLRDRVYENIMDEAFKDQGITALGEYFNHSMAITFINIMSFLLVYFVFRIALTFLISWLDYSIKFSRLRIGDNIVGGALGIVRGMIDISIVFMLVPAVLTVLPFDAIEEMINSSAMASFLHRSNIFLKKIPGTL